MKIVLEIDTEKQHDIQNGINILESLNVLNNKDEEEFNDISNSYQDEQDDITDISSE